MMKKNFLDENIPANKTIVDVFEKSNLDVFRAIDSELRTRYSFGNCKSFNADNVTQCHLSNAERLGNRAQLAQILFENKFEP